MFVSFLQSSFCCMSTDSIRRNSSLWRRQLQACFHRISTLGIHTSLVLCCQWREAIGRWWGLVASVWGDEGVSYELSIYTRSRRLSRWLWVVQQASVQSRCQEKGSISKAKQKESTGGWTLGLTSTPTWIVLGHGTDTPQTRKRSRPERRKQQDCLTEPYPLANISNSTGLDSAITFSQDRA